MFWGRMQPQFLSHPAYSLVTKPTKLASSLNNNKKQINK
jgi:hypothetical protein